MKLWRYVLLEVVIGACGLLVTGTAVGWGAATLAHRLDAYRLDRQSDLQPRRDLSTLSDPVIAAEPSGTFLGMADDLLLERVRKQAIVRVRVNKGGSSLSFRVEFADGSRAAFKPAQTNLQTIPRKEVAAYRINRLLGLNSVPPAIPRSVSRDDIFPKLQPDSRPSVPRIEAEVIFNPAGRTPGVFSYWIPEIKESGLDTPEGIRESAAWLAQDNPIPPEKRVIAAQLSSLIAFDFMCSNPDRYSGGNMKMSPDGTQLYYMDNTLAFFLDPNAHEKARNALLRTQRFSKRLYEALDRVTEASLTRLLTAENDGQEILTPSEIRAVVARRHNLQRYIESLMSTFGQRNVLVFP